MSEAHRQSPARLCAKALRGGCSARQGISPWARTLRPRLLCGRGPADHAVRAGIGESGIFVALIELEGDPLADVQPPARWSWERVRKRPGGREEHRAATRGLVAFEQRLVAQVDVAAVDLRDIRRRTSRPWGTPLGFGVGCQTVFDESKVHMKRAAFNVRTVVREIRAGSRHVGTAFNEQRAATGRVAVPDSAFDQSQACRAHQDRTRTVVAHHRPHKEGAAADEGECPLRGGRAETTVCPAIARACSIHLEAAL